MGVTFDDLDDSGMVHLCGLGVVWCCVSKQCFGSGYVMVVWCYGVMRGVCHFGV